MPVKKLFEKHKKDKLFSKKESIAVAKLLSEVSIHSRWELYKLKFIAGLFTGLGSAIGATFIFAIMLWVLSLFDQFPLIDSIVQSVQDALNK